MGLVGAAFGLGFIAGPAIGGALSRFGYAVPGFFAAALSLANAGAAYFYLPESLSPELRAQAVTRASATLVSRLRFAVAFARRPAIGLLLVIYGVTTLVFSAFTTVFPLWLGVERGYDAQHAGYLLAWFGLLMAIVQGRMLGPSAARVGERRLLVGATATLVVTYAVFPWFDNLWALCLGLIPLALGTGMSTPTLTSLASQYGEIDGQGTILGAIQSLSAAARMMGAAWAGWVFGAWGPASPYLANALFVSLAVTFAIVFMIRAPAPPAPRPEPVVRASV
jgi:predicted MFS family arabinose efflux permease